MKKLHVKLNFLEPILGTAPADPEIYNRFIGSKGPDALSMEEEIEALGAEAVAEKGMTVFPRNPDDEPIMWDYQVKGFFKDACGMLSRIGGKGSGATESSKLKAYKKTIDGLIFVEPRMIPIRFTGDMGICQRPLRAQTMQGERVALASSEEIPAGATMEFDIVLLDASHEAVVMEWLAYGQLRGLGQWRNSGKGRFVAEVSEA